MFRNALNKLKNYLPKPKRDPVGTLPKDMKNRSKMAEEKYAREQDAKNLEKLKNDMKREGDKTKDTK